MPSPEKGASQKNYCSERNQQFQHVNRLIGKAVDAGKNHLLLPGYPDVAIPVFKLEDIADVLVEDLQWEINGSDPISFAPAIETRTLLRLGQSERKEPLQETVIYLPSPQDTITNN